MTQFSSLSSFYDRTIPHNADAVAHGQQLVMVRADKNDPLALSGYLVDQMK